eukprot:CAMPEP_0198337366 /NCGR_PEP_ID=MMETSP1450-20131203/27444_1 /TAXON_ID=753684 ORGANISM="Madagascaria erythrocladiodes, Strain CCMP3234" /NCGR_SAMPLE_ID=MMETSP1450 /ASSEMBLY_ACC=CAM_ASM_001115 /LENGTH=49 /DNA_ID= /DNA_START= /DNA_END= /DNA_ORIENTATION=
MQPQPQVTSNCTHCNTALSYAAAPPGLAAQVQCPSCGQQSTFASPAAAA